METLNHVFSIPPKHFWNITRIFHKLLRERLNEYLKEIFYDIFQFIFRNLSYTSINRTAMRYLGAKRRAHAFANNSLTSLFLAQLTTHSPKGGSAATTTARAIGRT